MVNKVPAGPVTAKRLGSRSTQGALVLVTGAGSGIGRATALAFAARGSNLLSVDRNADAAEATAKDCRELGVDAHHYSCDVSDIEAMVALGEAVTAEHGTPDVVVNNAGVGMTGRFNDLTIEDWRWIRSINLDGVVHGCHVFGPAMVARGSGQIVNLSSGLGFTMRATEPAYVTTKAAVLALSQCLRADWSPHGVGVTAICPGIINTPIISTTRIVGTGDTEDERKKAQKLFNRGHKPELVANAIVDAVRRDLAVVPVGWESSLGWILHRFLPLRGQQFMARQSPF